MSDRSNRSSSGLVPALRELTDGVTELVRRQFQLLRVQIQREAAEASRRSAELLVFGGLALLGYALLNLAVVTGAGWWFGVGGMSAAALLLGAFHLGLGAWGVFDRLDGFEQQRDRIERNSELPPDEQAWLETTEN